MKTGGDCDREQLRETVVSAQKADIFQAVDDEHAENCRREKFPNVPDESRRFLILPEDEKRKKTCEHRAEHAQTTVMICCGTVISVYPPVVFQALGAAV